MTTDDDSTDSEDDQRPTRRPDGLIDTTGVDLPEQPSANGSESLDDTSLTPNNLVSARATKQLVEEGDGLEAGDERTDESEPASEDGAGGDDPETEVDESGSEPDESESEIDETETDEPDESAGDPEEAPEADEEDSSSSDSAPDAAADESSAGTGVEPERSDADRPGDGADADPRSETVAVVLNPMAVALAEWRVERTDDGVRTVDELASEALREYVSALLAGDATGGEEDCFAVDLHGSPGVERALDDLVGNDAEFESSAALVAEALTDALGGDADRTVELRTPAGHREYLDAVVRNPAYAFDDRAAVVEAAIDWTLSET